jgi:Uncharacterized protein conserved in bacteria (DUF2314)
MRLLCEEHAPKPDPELAARGQQYFLGKAVKKRFGTEHMWVHIDGLKGKVTLTGLLVNDPVTATRLRVGDRVSVRLKEIEQVDEIPSCQYHADCLIAGIRGATGMTYH